VKKKLMFASLAAGALAVSGLASALPTASAASTDGSTATHAVRVCTAHPKPGFATCFAMAMADANGKIIQSSKPLAAFTPADVQKAYNLKGLKSGGATVGIVDAYGYPTLEKDLAEFRKTYDLPPCTTKNGCLTIMGEDGGKPPSGDDGGTNWDLEQALDVDMVSAACPDCKIVVVEANGPSWRNLGTSVDTAAKQKGVVAISNSYGSGPGHDPHHYNYYRHPGIAITASTGDSGFQGPSAPASFASVIAVGGTSIVPDGSQRGYSETAWSGAGSGCSEKNDPPKYQDTKVTGCKGDAAADVSGPANPGQGGLNVYYNGHFVQVGGTSESSPMIAAVYALAHFNGRQPGAYPWEAKKGLYDITEGSNGSCGSPMCDAGKGWDGPTGLGTPNGVAAFGG
jgi:subtilase family serine protease